MADAKKAGAKSQAKGNNPKAEGKGKSKKGDLGYELAPDGNPDQKKGPSRLRVRYQKEILPALMKERASRFAQACEGLFEGMFRENISSVISDMVNELKKLTEK